MATKIPNPNVERNTLVTLACLPGTGGMLPQEARDRACEALLAWVREQGDSGREVADAFDAAMDRIMRAGVAYVQNHST